MLKSKRVSIYSYLFQVLLLLLITFIAYILWVSYDSPPDIKDTSSLALEREGDNGFYFLKNNWFRKSQSGLYEMYVEGDAFERGVMNGKLSKELVVRQEAYFNEQINKMIPSKFYRNFLKYFVGWFNRDLDNHIANEYKQEIYGISHAASDQYQYIGSNYQRILNYHAAHDIGHALQNLALVGCTSFGTWGNLSEDGTMIVGRNFDFYVGDKFAEDKIVAFFNPTNGHKYMTITWGGFVGAVSGMNERGLSVTINAAKSDIPSGSATPVSLVAREILQYAQNINEAVAIAKKRKMFVAESFLVASAADHKAVVIEKTPDSLDIYDPHKNLILCANHFQSQHLSKSSSNQTQMEQSASVYRYEHLMERLNRNGKNTVEKTINILRDRQGFGNVNIGNGNEKAINQLIAHHAVVFEPEKRLVWVSTSPYQLGKFIAYDLNKVFGLRGMKTNQEICNTNLTVAADTFLLSREYQQFEKFRNYKKQISAGEAVNIDSLVASNPQFYQVYTLAADTFFKNKQYDKARIYYQLALSKVIPTKQEENEIGQKIMDIVTKRQ